MLNWNRTNIQYPAQARLKLTTKVSLEEQAGLEFSGKKASANSLSDRAVEDLVVQVQEGNTEALGEIYDRYAGRVYAFLLRAVEQGLAEELLQDVFVALWQKARLFDPNRGSFNAWFFTMIRRRMYDALPAYQKRRSENSLSEPGISQAAFEIPDNKSDLEEQVLRLFRDEEVRMALQHLPPEQRQIIMMTYFGGLSHRELALKLKLPVSTIKGRARLGLQRLRQLLPERL
jgi:RNA polymerase sigma-70 factor (ECF subfamily)